jgi:hypothetical protein
MQIVPMFIITRAMGEYNDSENKSASSGTLLMAPSSGFKKFNAKLHSADLRPELRTMRIRTRRGDDRRDRIVGVACARGMTTGSVRSMSLEDAIARNCSSPVGDLWCWREEVWAQRCGGCARLAWASDGREALFWYTVIGEQNRQP